jgi:chorismate synthase
VSDAVSTPLEFRLLTSADELAVLPEFEQRVWGGEFEMVSVNILVATISEGGLALAAFDGDRVIGAVYGFPTRDAHVMHSHYMAVDPAYRRRGLAVQLKQRQRAWCLEQGYTHVRWTYDPLQLANAHLNLHVLGAVGVHYHRNHYGSLGGINGMLPSDRVTVSWDLRPVPSRPVPEMSVDVPPFAPDAIAASSPEAHAARLAVRAGLEDHLGHGWLLVDIDREARRYLLARDPAH